MDIKVRSKLWIEVDGRPVFGRGRGFLLAAIDKQGSINQGKVIKEFQMCETALMCATLHNNRVVKKGQTVAGTRAIPLTVKKSIVQAAVSICWQAKRQFLS